MSNQGDKAALLRSLHVPGAPLVLPNAWDVGSARAIVDAEAGYGLAPDELTDVLTRIGVVGCNIEDSDHSNGGLIDVGVPATYIGEMRAAANRIGVPLVINARIDSFFPTSPLPEGKRRADAISRADAYWSAGADCVFVPGAGPEDLRAVVTDVGAPVNAGLPLKGGSLEGLRAIGVARVSVGPQLYRSALEHLRADLQPLIEALQ